MLVVSSHTKSFKKSFKWHQANGFGIEFTKCEETQLG